MYLPFCGISISNAKLFSESRKEYERSRVRRCELCVHKSYLITTDFLLQTLKKYSHFCTFESSSGNKKPICSEYLKTSTGSAGGGQWPVRGADWSGEDCEEDHAASTDTTAVWAVLRTSPWGHWLTSETPSSLPALQFLTSVSDMYTWKLCGVSSKETVAAFDECLFFPKVVKFSKTFELMSPLCNMDRDIGWESHSQTDRMNVYLMWGCF